MRQVNIEVFRGEKRVRRYTEYFHGADPVPNRDRKKVALARIIARFGKCWPGCEFRIYPYCT